MASFFRKKKKSSPVESRKALNVPREPPATQVVQEQPEKLAELTSSTDCELSPTVVREPSSIFGGLVLNPSVKKREQEDSPYLSKRHDSKSESDNQPSAFGFIAGGGDMSVPATGGCEAQEDMDTEGRGGGEKEKSAFGFISSDPTDSSPGKEEKSGFSFISAAQPDTESQPRGEKETKGDRDGERETITSSEDIDSSLMTPKKTSSQPPDHSISLGSSTPRQADPAQTVVFHNSSGITSPVPGPMSPPLLTSHPSPPASGAATEGGERVSVGRQQPTSGKKKKKRKVVRPGQERMEDPILVDTSSEPTEAGPTLTNTLPNREVGEFKGSGEVTKSELDSLSVASQTSSVDTSSTVTGLTLAPEMDTSSIVTGLTLAPEMDISSTVTGLTLAPEIVSESGTATKQDDKSGSNKKDVVKTEVGKREEGEREDGEREEGEREEGEREEGERVQRRERENVAESASEEMVTETPLLVDTSNIVVTSEGVCVEGEEGGRKGVTVFQDQQLLAEVFAGDRSESGEPGEGVKGAAGGGEDQEKTALEAKTGNYSVELTSSDQLTLLIQSSESNLARIRLELAEVHSKKQSLLEEHVSAARQQKHSRQRLKELRARETKALADEDYELAEELQGQLESVSRDSSWSVASAAHPLLREWLQEVCELVDSEEKVQSEMRTQLANMREQQSEALASAEEKIAASQTKQKMKLKALEDKIERERGHIALDKEHLHKREQQLEEEIASRAERFISKKSSLQEELQTVHSAIAELEERLAGLRQEGEKLESAIAEEEARIQAVHHELESEDCSLRDERESIATREQDLLTQQEGVEKVKKEYEVALNEQMTQKESISGVLGRVDMRWEESERRTHTLDQCRGRAGDLGHMDTTSLLCPSSQLQRSRAVVEEKEREVREVGEKVEALQRSVSQLRQQISVAEERIPRLEESKKTAVAARQYKEAGRIASELKQLKTDLEPQQTQLREREGQVTELSQRLGALSGDLARERGHLDQLEKQEDVEHLKQLVSSIARLQATKASIPGSVTAPLGQVLDSWFQLYQLLADGLCAKHDLDLADFTPHTEPHPPEEEEEEEEESDQLTVMKTDDANMTGAIPSSKPPEERTPGVGQEGEEEEREGAGREGEQRRQTEAEQVKKEIRQLESRIEEAVSEEVEDYELAAELDKQLSALKEKLTQLLAS